MTLEHLIESISDGTQEQDSNINPDAKARSLAQTQMNNSGPFGFNSVDSQKMSFENTANLLRDK